MTEAELLEKARKLMSVEFISPGAIQRRLMVSYNQAEHLTDTVIDELKEEAIILRRFQDWRKGYDIRTKKEAEIDPKELSTAIDRILAFFDLPKPITNCTHCKWNGEKQGFTGCIKVSGFENRECKFERAEE